MSVTSIPDKVRLEVWVKAGGRCQFHGCNKPLWRDDLTLKQMNRAYLAHIVADRPRGARGDPILSDQLKNKFSNIMLLCGDHHTLVDERPVTKYTVDVLRQFKADHEHRIERQTHMQSGTRTEIVRFAARIRDRAAFVTVEQVQDTIAADRYPASEAGINIDLSTHQLTEADEAYWETARVVIDNTIDLAIATGTGPTGHPLSHASIFALGPIPLLVHLGKKIGDQLPADVYQRHRESESWAWRDLDDDGFNYTLIRPEPAEECSDVAVCLSLSGSVQMAEVERVVGADMATYVLTISNPRVDFLRAKDQLELFRVEWRRLLTEVREIHGPSVKIHLFPAVPNSIAVEAGRTLLPKSDPEIIVYDHDRDHGGFRRVMTV